MNPFIQLLRTWFPFKAEPFVSLDNDGLSIWDDGQIVHRVDWSDVVAIDGFKLDLFTYDSIRLSFNLAEGLSLDVDEDIDGFDQLVAAIEQRYAIDHGWWSIVAFPAFESNLTRLWTMPAPGDSLALAGFLPTPP